MLHHHSRSNQQSSGPNMRFSYCTSPGLVSMHLLIYNLQETCQSKPVSKAKAHYVHLQADISHPSLFSMYSANIYVIGNHIFLFQHVVLVVCRCPILDCVNGKPMMVSESRFLAFKPTSEILEEKRSAFQWALFSRLQALLSVQSLYARLHLTYQWYMIQKSVYGDVIVALSIRGLPSSRFLLHAEWVFLTEEISKYV